MKARNTFSVKTAQFLKGTGSVLNLAGNSLNSIKIGDMSDDLKALGNDWACVGQAIGKAEKHQSEQWSQKKTTKYGSTRFSR